MIQTRYSNSSHDDSREYPIPRTDEDRRLDGAKNQHRQLHDPTEASKLNPTWDYIVIILNRLQIYYVL